MRDQFLTALATSLNCDPAVVSRTGVTVAASQDRAQNHRTSGYLLGDHFVVACDPAAEQLLNKAVADMAPTLEAWQRVALDAGGELVGSARMQVLGGDLPHFGELAHGYTLHQLDRDNADDVALIGRFIETSDANDLDEAEIELANLDRTILVALDHAGEIAAYSSARPFDLAPKFGDIGIMTRSDSRHQGLGTELVGALCPLLRAAGLEPLYCCGEGNAGSVRLSAALGFEIATQLVAFQFPTA